jgi:hypothetical protein
MVLISSNGRGPIEIIEQMVAGLKLKVPLPLIRAGAVIREKQSHSFSEIGSRCRFQEEPPGCYTYALCPPRSAYSSCCDLPALQDRKG